MFKLKCWSSALLLAATMAAPILAENNNAKTPNDNTPNTASAEATAAADPNPNPAPSPSLSPSVSLAATDANVTALLGVLVMKVF